MKNNLLTVAALAGCVAVFAGCATDLTTGRTVANRLGFGVSKPVVSLQKIEIKNFQNESLGRIEDLGIDLINGRIIVVLVETDLSLGLGNKIVAVPPLALYHDLLDDTLIYRLNVTTTAFKAAPEINLKQWTDDGRSTRVAAAYRHFGQEPYFLEEGDTSSRTANRPKVPLGYVERSSRILNMPVGNLQNEKFGNVFTLTLDILGGRIRSVVVLAPGNLKTKSVIPATALSFNEKRDGLLLDSTKQEFADEPRYILTGPLGESSQEEAYKGPRTTDALEQGRSRRDVDRTVRINEGIRAANIVGQRVEVGTINSRVTLRGTVNTSEDKRRIGDIAIAASRLELVDNQIKVSHLAGNN